MVVIAQSVPTRPALRYYGGKWNLAPWIISHFPPHKNYVEPCGGAASVLLQKPRSLLETYNDLDGNVVNFFRVLRDKPDELIRKIELTPWARTEFELSKKPSKDPIEAARRFYMCAQMGISASQRASSGMRMVYEVAGGIPAVVNSTAKHLYDIAKRLLGVQIENRDALKLITLTDSFDTFFYFDPPYLGETRASKAEYTIEASDIDFHIAAGKLLNTVMGYVIISGYTSSLYTELYEFQGWHRIDKEAQTNGEKRIESLWLSPRTYKALNNDFSDLPMFKNGSSSV